MGYSCCLHGVGMLRRLMFFLWQTGEADVDETHELRCCSTTELDGWNKYASAPGCWGLSMFDKDGPDNGCVHAIDFNAGRALCQEHGGDLCTMQQLKDECTRGSGCQHDHDLIWSLDPVQPDQAPTTAPTPSPASFREAASRYPACSK